METALRDEKETSVYTYEVKMTISVMAEHLELANEKLEMDGGYVHKREVVLLDSTNVYSTQKKLKKSK
jgi:hypothetical protein